MKHFTKLLASLPFLIFMVAFIGCSNPSSSDNGGSSSDAGTTNDAPVVTSLTGTYRGSLTGNGETIHMRMTFNSNFTFVTQGYTDNTFTNTTGVGSASGVYTLSGNTATCTVTVGNQNFVVYATTSDNWASVICSGLYEGTMTKE